MCALERVYEVQTSSDLFFKMEPGFTGRAGYGRLTGTARRSRRYELQRKSDLPRICLYSHWTIRGGRIYPPPSPPRVIHLLSEWFDWLLARRHWTQKCCCSDPVAPSQQLLLIQTGASDPAKCFHFKKTIVPRSRVLSEPRRDKPSPPRPPHQDQSCCQDQDHHQ